jgi:hypothetical protein
MVAARRPDVPRLNSVDARRSSGPVLTLLVRRIHPTIWLSALYGRFSCKKTSKR